MCVCVCVCVCVREQGEYPGEDRQTAFFKVCQRAAEVSTELGAETVARGAGRAGDSRWGMPAETRSHPPGPSVRPKQHTASVPAALAFC